MLKFKDNVLDAILFHLYRQEHTAEVALLELRKTVGEDAMSLKEVTEFYKKADKGEYELKVSAEEEERVLNVTTAFGQHQVYTRVLANLDLVSRLNLLETNLMLRQHSSETKIHINLLSINFTMEYTKISTDDGYEKVFLTDEPRIRLDDGPSQYLDRHWEFYQKIGLQLKKILQFNSVTIGTFRIQLMCDESLFCINQHIWSLHDALQIALLELQKPLKVDKFITNVREHSQFVICHLDPAYLESLVLGIYNRKLYIGLPEEVSESLPWRNCTGCQVKHVVLSRGDLMKFSHFQVCKLRVKSEISVEEVVELKEALLRNPFLCHFKITSSLSREQVDAVCNALNLTNSSPPVWTRFLHPGGLGNVLFVCVTRKMIWFKGPLHEMEEDVEEDDGEYIDPEDDEDENEDEEEEEDWVEDEEHEGEEEEEMDEGQEDEQVDSDNDE